MSYREIPWIEPEVALAAFGDEPWVAFLDSGGPVSDTRARWSYLCVRPVATLVRDGDGLWRDGRAVAGDVWSHLREMRADLGPCSGAEVPFGPGLVGVASYGMGLACEGVVSRHRDGVPQLAVGAYDTGFAFDRLTRRCFALGEACLPEGRGRALGMALDFSLEFAADFSRAEWMAAVREVVRLIGAGDLFQANLTMRFSARVADDFDALAAYGAIRRAQPAPFGAYLRMPGVALLSASVERFLSVSASGVVEARPIKGTISLGRDDAQTARLAQALSEDAKERAENLMITDLMRNDIGRVCALGSVTVPQLCAVERFAHVQHLVSGVRGVLGEGFDVFDLLRAAWPAGSVTGAPKRRALEVIDGIERSARGLYCGSVFRIGADGALDSSVIIRSAECSGSILRVGTGGGMTWLSDPAREYEEARLKVAPLLRVFGA